MTGFFLALGGVFYLGGCFVAVPIFDNIKKLERLSAVEWIPLALLWPVLALFALLLLGCWRLANRVRGLL